VLGFIVPVKPKKYSKNWDLDNQLLERTIKSIFNQKEKDFKVVIVHNDLPEIKFSHPELYYQHYPYGDFSIDQIEDWEDRRKWYAPAYAERMMDKGRKIMMGCKSAKELGCTYLMAVDSDDLVSNKLAGFVNENQNKKLAGWRFVDGYMYEDGSRIIIKNHQIWGINGSTHIIRHDLVEVPDLATNQKLFDVSLFEGHAYAFQRIKDFNNESLDFLPFFGVIYIIHKNNHSNIKSIISAVTPKQIVKKILYGKILTSNIRNEFGLYQLPR
jgi:hypothetical protein